MTDTTTNGTERYEVVIDGTESGMERDHAELLKRRLVHDGFHDHAVTVRSVDTETDRCDRCGTTDMRVRELGGEQLCTRHRVEELGGECPQ